MRSTPGGSFLSAYTIMISIEYIFLFSAFPLYALKITSQEYATSIYIYRHGGV